MEVGRYKGYYQYNDTRYLKHRDFERTYFTIQITNFDGHKFNGSVQDDIATGGMEGIGEVSGAIYSDGIMFVKKMPYLGVLIQDTASEKYIERINKNRKHMPIYYDGVEIENNHYKGTWSFRHGLITTVFSWLCGMKLGGTWEMSKVNNT